MGRLVSRFLAQPVFWVQRSKIEDEDEFDEDDKRKRTARLLRSRKQRVGLLDFLHAYHPPFG